MDLQKLVDAMNAAGEQQRSNYHLTLGALIRALEAASPEIVVAFSSGGHPTGPHSYRGYYSDLSFKPQSATVTAAELLAICRGALGETFEGYKGGDFVMTERTPLWRAPYGDCGDAIVSANLIDGRLVLETRNLDGD